MMNIEKEANKIYEAETDNFLDLVRISNLDPKADFRHANFDGMDLGGCDLSGLILQVPISVKHPSQAPIFQEQY